MWKSRSTARSDGTRLLPDRETPVPINGTHFVLGTSMVPPYPDGSSLDVDFDLDESCSKCWHSAASLQVVTGNSDESRTHQPFD